MLELQFVIILSISNVRIMDALITQMRKVRGLLSRHEKKHQDFTVHNATLRAWVICVCVTCVGLVVLFTVSLSLMYVTPQEGLVDTEIILESDLEQRNDGAYNMEQAQSVLDAFTQKRSDLSAN